MPKIRLPMVAFLASITASLAQQQPLPPPGSLTTPPAVPNPLAPQVPVNPAPADTLQQPPGTLPPSAEQSKTPDISGPTEVMLEARPVLMLKGQSSWDDGFDTLTEAFQKLAAEAKKNNLRSVGRPQAAFTSTDDFGFKYEAMLALEQEPANAPAGLAKDFTIARSPNGKALKFTHTGAYDDIDTSYEAITAYLDEKNLKARDIFVEEYINDPKNSEDASLEMNIYVLVE